MKSFNREFFDGMDDSLGVSVQIAYVFRDGQYVKPSLGVIYTLEDRVACAAGAVKSGDQFPGIVEG